MALPRFLFIACQTESLPLFSKVQQEGSCIFELKIDLKVQNDNSIL